MTDKNTNKQAEKYIDTFTNNYSKQYFYDFISKEQRKIWIFYFKNYVEIEFGSRVVFWGSDPDLVFSRRLDPVFSRSSDPVFFDGWIRIKPTPIRNPGIIYITYYMSKEYFIIIFEKYREGKLFPEPGTIGK